MAEAILFHALPIAIKPFWLDLLFQPFWHDSCQHIEGMPQCFPNQFEGIEDFDCPEHMRGIGSLPPTSAEIASLLTPFKEGIQQLAFQTSLRASGPEILRGPNNEIHSH